MELTSHHEHIKQASTCEIIHIENRKPEEGLVYNQCRVKDIRRLCYLSLLFSGTLHSVGCIFPFLPCLSFFFFPQLFVKPLQTTISLLAFPFLWDGFDHCLLYNVTNLHPQFFRILSTRSNHLNLFVTSTVES